MQNGKPRLPLPLKKTADGLDSRYFGPVRGKRRVRVSSGDPVVIPDICGKIRLCS